MPKDKKAKKNATILDERLKLAKADDKINELAKVWVNELTDGGPAYTDYRIVDFFKLVSESTVRQIEEIEAKLAYEMSMMINVYTLNITEFEKMSVESGVGFYANKEMQKLFQNMLSAYGFELNIKAKHEICAYFKHEKMPQVFKDMANNKNLEAK